MMNRSHQKKQLKKHRRTHNSTHKKERKYARKRQEQEDAWWLQAERPGEERPTERQKTAEE
jgi:hypothetical protein